MRSSYSANDIRAQAERRTDGADDLVTTHHPITEDYAPFTPVQMKAMRSSLKQQGLLMPIVTWNGMIVDGRHREKLCRELRILPRYLEINKKRPTEDDMRMYVAGLNEHRRSRTRPLTNEEKRAKAETAITADPARSDVAIHEELDDVSRPTVHRVRKALEERGVVPRTTPKERKSRSGKVGEGARKNEAKPANSGREVVSEKAKSAAITPAPTVDEALNDQALEDRVDCILVHMALTELGEAIGKVEPEMVAAGVVLPDEVSQMLDEVGTIRHWLDRFVALLDGSLVWKEVDDGYVAVLHDDRAYIIMRDEAELGDEEEPEGYNVSYVDPHQNTDTDNNWHHHEKLGTNVATAEMAKEIAQRHADKAEDLRDAATQ